jgi:biopolymer transport protein ExbD
MVFRKTGPGKDIELPTFIDVVFLLLIFFLVSYSPITPKKGQEELELSLPTAQGAGEVNANEPLETMLIEIVPLKSEENKEDYEVWVLLPFESYSNSQKGRVTYRDAKTFSMQFQRTAVLPKDVAALNEADFLRLPAIQLMNDQIDSYVTSQFRIPHPTNRIDIRADEDVQFRIIDFIMDKCSSYEDLVPSMVFRTRFKVE